MNVRLLALTAAMLVSLAPGAAQQISQGRITARSVFQGQIPGREGDGAPPRVDIRLWSIRGHQRVAGLVLPLRGVMIVELRAGEVTTIIGGRRVERREGDIWTVPEDAVMQLETEDDTAVIQTTVVGD